MVDSKDMKRIVNYVKGHPIEVVYASVFIACIVLSIVRKTPMYILFALLLYLVSILVEFILFLLTAKTPLDIKTPDGYNEPYHPSVIFFKGGWNGYKYWMAFTPMPKKAKDKPYTDRWECPCVYASNDGISFAPPGGGEKKFIDDLTSEEIANKDYFSDTHLVYNENSNQLELYYRLTNQKEGAINGEHLWLLRKTSNDGITWSNREELIKSTEAPESIGPVYISPAIIRENEEYLMWFVSAYGDNRPITFAKSRDMKTFDFSEKCKLIGRECDPWHIDCRIIDGKYVLLIYEFSNELSIWESIDGTEFCFQKLVLRASNCPGAFYHAVYRSCITENDCGGYSLYFSAQNQKEVLLGIANGNVIDSFNIVNGNGKKQYSLFCEDIVRKYYNLIRIVFQKCEGKNNA